MKGSNKKFARYLDSEYYDDYLEAPDNYEKEDEYDFEEANYQMPDPSKGTTQPSKGPKDKAPDLASSKKNQKKIHKPDVKVFNKQTPLTNELIKNFVSLLGSEAKKCFHSLKEIKVLENDSHALDAYRDLSAKFETVPVLYLSVVPKQAVYVWQINRKCPFQKGTKYMVVDSKAMTMETKPHLSFLMLAKITPKKNEEIIDAQFCGEETVLVKSRLSDSTMSIRFYKIKSFVNTTRVNPFKYEALANDLYSFEFILKRATEGLDTLEISLFKRKAYEEATLEASQQIEAGKLTGENKIAVEMETLLDRKVFSGLASPFRVTETSFDEIHTNSNGVVLLIDKDLPAVLAWKDKSYYASYLNPAIGDIESVFTSKEGFYIMDEQKNIYEINLNNFPTVEIVNPGVTVALSYITLENIKHQPKKLCDVSVNHRNPQIYYLNDTQIFTSPFQKSDNNEPPVLFADLTEKLKKAKAFNWSVCGHLNNSFIVYICDQYIHFYSLQRFERSFTIPHQDAGIKTWDIIGSGHRLFLCGRSPNSIDVQLIEVCITPDHVLLFNGNYAPDFHLVTKEGGAYRYNEADGLFGQIEGPNSQIAFIRFTNEPFYVDTLNLVYDEPLSLINPSENEKGYGVGGKNEEEELEWEKEKKLHDKMNKAKTALKHTKDVQGGLEETKEALKEIRKDIGNRITQVKKFDEEYSKTQKQQNQTQNEKSKPLKEPKGVSKESIQLYGDIKIEKKKMVKDREKEKTKNKKERDTKNEH